MDNKEDTDRVTVDEIAWERYDESGNIHQSKIHLIDADDRNPSRTFCGIRIPNEGNGVEVGHGSDYGDGSCKRCLKRDGRQVIDLLRRILKQSKDIQRDDYIRKGWEWWAVEADAKEALVLLGKRR